MPSVEPELDDTWPDLLRVVLCGSSCPGVVRPGFLRTWGVQVVSDMFADEEPDTLEAAVRCGHLHTHSSVHAEVTGDRLRIHVPLQPPRGLACFHVELTATVHGRIVLPLTIGPIAVALTLPRPLPPASWSREIPLSFAWSSAGSSPTLRIAEAQTSTAIIASATWDPGVLLALYLAHAWDAGVLRAQAMDNSQPLRVIELGCGVGVAGLALAAAGRDKVRITLTDGDASACTLYVEQLELRTQPHLPVLL
uniref:Calmodulin-lysine N-methyltransferase n=1 Tax=Haptolina brevifila TaxID=156173 RepID=A0A7S2ILR8_9EUKA|mmetsp:Transcript_67976/g.134743  ORF Transcript_67976/g.134743 Transcript_67976/m.134743 type:complete len:251 (+) Transcript_67976:56-808(+)